MPWWARFIEGGAIRTETVKGQRRDKRLAMSLCRLDVDEVWEIEI
jgi:hypothetical protein